MREVAIDLSWATVATHFPRQLGSDRDRYFSVCRTREAKPRNDFTFGWNRLSDLWQVREVPIDLS